MEKNFSKSFRFMGFDVNLSSAKEKEEKKEMSTKYTDSEEYKNARNKEEKKKTSTKYTDFEEFKKEKESEKKSKESSSNIGVAISILAGYGAFKLVKGVAKAFVKSKTPIGAAGLIAFEGACALYSACKTLDLCDGIKEGFGNFKKTVMEGYNDDVRE